MSLQRQNWTWISEGQNKFLVCLTVQMLWWKNMILFLKIDSFRKYSQKYRHYAVEQSLSQNLLSKINQKKLLVVKKTYHKALNKSPYSCPYSNFMMSFGIKIDLIKILQVSKPNIISQYNHNKYICTHWECILWT